MKYRFKFLVILIGLAVFLAGYLTSKVVVHKEVYDLLSKTEKLHVEERIEKIDEFLINAERKIKNSPSLLELDSGQIIMTKSDFPELVNPDGCEPNRGLKNIKVLFNKKFLHAPQVRLALTGLDFRHGTDSRVKSSVRNITEDSFTLDLLTWCDTKLSYAEINWIAYSTHSNSPH